MKIGVIAAIAALSLLALSSSSGALKFVPFGVNFSPYENGQNGSSGIILSEDQVYSRLKKIRGYSSWIRTFSVTHGMESAGALAHNLGFKTAIGAWLGPEPSWDTSGYYHGINEAEVTNLIAAANRGEVDVAIVGSEALLRGDLSSTQLLGYIEQVHASIPSNIPVTTVDTYDTLMVNPDVMSACDIIMANFYPYWEGDRIDTAMSALDGDYRALVRAAGSKEVWVAETGWPSDGDPVESAVPNAKNAAYFWLAFNSWAETNDVQSFYFEAFDEAWKAADEGPEGAHWGIRTATGGLKPYRSSVYTGCFLPPEAYMRSIPYSYLPGSPGVELTIVPAYGSDEGISGIVSGVPTSEYVIATYIQAWIGWWNKPTWDQPTVPINPDGTFYVDTVTGGEDADANDFLVFVIPKSYSPPLVGGGDVPDEVYSNAVAYVEFPRSPDFPGFTNYVSKPNLSSLTIKRTFGDTSKAGDKVSLGGTVPLADAAVSGSSVKVTVAGTDWQFEPLAADGKASVTGSEDGQTGKIAVSPKKDCWKFSATLGCLPGNTNWTEYGLIDATLKAPGIPVFVPVIVTVNATNSYECTVSSYYTATAGKSGQMSGSSKTPSN
jgi:exo-beta-1,3-glucanase (GH17 family)